MAAYKGTISSFSAIVSFIAVALLGYFLLPGFPVKLAPDESLPAVDVRYSMPGASSRTVEAEVTSRLEGVLSRIDGVRHIHSRSYAGGGRVTLELDRNTNLETARFETAMAVRQTADELPEGVSYPSVSVMKVDYESSRPFMSFTVNAGMQPSDIMRFCEERIRPAISAIDGVAKVELSGAMPWEWVVEYDSGAMREYGLTPEDIAEAINAAIFTEHLGMARVMPGDGEQRMRIAAGDGKSRTVDPAGIVLGKRGGEVITLGKVAVVSHREAAPDSYFRINGLNSVYVNVTSAKDAGQTVLSRKVRETLSSVRMPEGFVTDLSYDASERISRELDKIYVRTALTVAILLVFVGLITLSIRYLLLIAIGLAINMGVAFVFYYFLGVEIQLYSLAGIAISINLVIDNLIVMTEHVTRRRDLGAFPAVVAATLTTIGALSVVFFLDERTMLSLRDFVIVVAVNLIVSLAVALFLVPALVDKMGVRVRRSTGRRGGRTVRWIGSAYGAVSRFVCRHRVMTVAFFILAFGLPVFMLPEKIEGEGRWAGLYNKTLGSGFYNTHMRKWVDYALGGTLRLFVEDVYDGSYLGGDTEPVLYVNATLPNGATLKQMNALMEKMECFLSTKDGVSRFSTSVYNARRADIQIHFKEKEQHSGYPYRLKSEIVSEALTLGGGSWSVYGLNDQGFSNDVRESAGSFAVRMSGYNYDRLYSLANELRDSLLTHRRIREVTVNCERTYWKDDYTEYYLGFDRERLAKDSLSVMELADGLDRVLGRGAIVAELPTPQGVENVRLVSSERNRDVWGVMNFPFSAGGKTVKLSDYATLDKMQTPPDVVRKDREYILYLQYEYIGSNVQGEKVLDRMLERFTPRLPLGYNVQWEKNFRMFGEDSSPYALLLLIAAVIFFVAAIQFNSLRQPLAIIFVMPVSFIGVFLTFYLFGLKFDNGGFAAFILLCGITVNAAIYIIDEYDSLCSRHPGEERRKLYMKAFSVKIKAVFLTVLSTVLGFIPFLVGETREGFWFPLAAGTMGGLVMSLAAIFLLLPVFVLGREKSHKCQSHLRSAT